MSVRQTLSAHPEWHGTACRKLGASGKDMKWKITQLTHTLFLQGDDEHCTSDDLLELTVEIPA